jgi:hypothetical protein
MTIGDAILSFLVAFCGGYVAARLVGLVMYLIKQIKTERARRVRLKSFKWRRDY